MKPFGVKHIFIKIPIFSLPKTETDFELMPNQNLEQIARDSIDMQLSACGWIIQDVRKINLHAGIGVAVREYLTDVGPADYLLC